METGCAKIQWDEVVKKEARGIDDDNNSHGHKGQSMQYLVPAYHYVVFTLLTFQGYVNLDDLRKSGVFGISYR
jgi:hypothetical protein